MVGVAAADLGLYEWGGPTSKEHRKEIRDYKAASWLATNVCDKERQVDRVREALLAHLREEKLEQPAADRIRRIIGSAISQAEKAQIRPRDPGTQWGIGLGTEMRTRDDQ